MFAIGISACACFGQQVASEYESVLQESVFPVKVENNQISGAGADWLTSKSEKCQFVLFGEQHGVVGLPNIVSASYGKLYQSGFHYFVMERGPWISRLLARNGVEQTVAQYPYAIAFDYDGEVELLKNVESKFDGVGDAFWGVDQSLTAIHALHRLSEILPTYSARRASRGLFLKDAIQGGRFLNRDHSSDIQALRELAGEDIDEEAAMILDALEKSQDIFLAYFAGERNEHGIGVSDILREQYMIHAFDKYMETTAALGNSMPKAILKMGGAHVMEGVGPNGVSTLGEHIQRVAEANGFETIHLSIHSHTEKSNWPDTVFADSDVVLIETERLKELLKATPEAVVPSLHREISGYDGIILMKGAGQDTSSQLKGYEASFRKRLILSLTILLFPALTTISLLVPLYRKTMVRKGENASNDPFLPWGLSGALSIILLSIVAVQVIRFRQFDSPEVSRLSGSWVMPCLETACILLTLVCFILMFKKAWWSLGQRVHFSIVCIGLVTLALYCHVFYIGRMIS